MNEVQWGDVLRRGALMLAAVLAITSFVHGFGALMSQAWPTAEGRRVEIDTWQLLPPLQPQSTVKVLAEGFDVSLAQYRFKVGGHVFYAPRLKFGEPPTEHVEVHYLSLWPQLAYPAPGFPWPTMLMIPLLCSLFTLWLVRSRQISRLLRDSAPARAQLAARKPVMR